MENYVLTHLRGLADEGYREFNGRIAATGYEIMGVRIPDLRKYAKQLAAGPDDDLVRYLDGGVGDKPFFEEAMLYGLVLAAAANRRKMPLEEVFRRFEALVPHFDSWAHVDVVVSDFKIFAKHREEVFRRFLPLKTHPGEFTKRTFVIVLMDFFMDGEHIERTLKEFAEVEQGQYYVDMAIAWALSVALVKHWDRALPLLQNPVFSRFVHNKAIQKARESYRITPEQKEHLNTLNFPPKNIFSK